MQQVVEGVIRRHEALRLRFHLDAHGWASSIAPASEALPYSNHDLSGLPATEQRAAIEARGEELQRSLSLGQAR